MTDVEEYEKTIAGLEKELSIVSEMLATVLLVTGPVRVVKGQSPRPNDTISVDFDQDGSGLVIGLDTNGQ